MYNPWNYKHDPLLGGNEHWKMTYVPGASIRVILEKEGDPTQGK